MLILRHLCLAPRLKLALMGAAFCAAGIFLWQALSLHKIKISHLQAKLQVRQTEAAKNEASALPQTYNYMGRVPNIKNWVSWKTILEDGRVLSWQEVMAAGLAAHPMSSVDVAGPRVVKFAGTFGQDVLWSHGVFYGGDALSLRRIGPGPQPSPDAPALTAVQIKDGIDLVSGGNFRLVLRKDGTVWGFGGNEYGQLGTHVNDWEGNDLSEPVMKLNKVIAIAAGFRHAIALKKDGTVWEWGSNTPELARNVYGTFPGPPRRDYFAPEPRRIGGLPRIIKIASGDFHNVALDEAGHVWAWGKSVGGRLGIADQYRDSEDPKIDAPSSYVKAPVRVPGVSDMTDIAAAGGHTLALKKDGAVWAWGVSANGQLGEADATTSQAYGLMETGGRLVYPIAGIVKVKKIFTSRMASALVQEDDGLWLLGMGPWFYFPFAVAVRGEPGALTKVRFSQGRMGASEKLALESEFGIYRIDDSRGRVGGLGPGESGYAQAALSPDRAIPIFQRKTQYANAKGFTNIVERTIPLKAGELFAFYVIRNGSLETWRDGQTANNPREIPQSMFSYPAANSGGKIIAEFAPKTATYDSVTVIWNFPAIDGVESALSLGLTGFGLDPLPQKRVQKDALAEVRQKY